MAHIEFKARCDDLMAIQARVEALCGRPVSVAESTDYYFQSARPQAQEGGFLFKLRQTKNILSLADISHERAVDHINPVTGETESLGAGAADRYALGEMVAYQRTPLKDETGQQTQLSVLNFQSPDHVQLTRDILRGGYYPDVTVQKRRAQYETRDKDTGQLIRVHLDEVKGLGSFVEVECKYDPDEPHQKERAIDTVLRFKRQLGVADAQVVLSGYAALTKEQQIQEHPELAYPLLRTLPEPLRQKIVDAPRVGYDTGETIIKAGAITDEEDKKAYVILSGAAGVYEGGKKILELGPGDTVGEYYKLNPDKPMRLSNVCALEPVNMIELSDSLLGEMLEHPGFMREVLHRRVHASLEAVHRDRGLEMAPGMR